MEEVQESVTNYALATELNKKPEAVQVATLLTVIGEKAREVFSTFTDWAAEGDDAKIEPVLAKFAQYPNNRTRFTSWYIEYQVKSSHIKHPLESEFCIHQIRSKGVG